MKNKRKIFRIIWFCLVIIFFSWQWTTYQSHDLPKNTFLDSDKVLVIENKDEIVFKSKSTTKQLEIIFFQGGLTDPKAYAPLCKNIAEDGFTCHLIKMDWRMPQWSYAKINTMFDLKKGNYIIGGHSQGAKMAAQYVYENPQQIKGLFLIGTSHPRDIDLSNLKIPTLKLYAENDGLASVSEVMENKNKLPKNTRLTLIKGANHSQFGYLGRLLTDSKASISLEQQQKETLNHLIIFFNEL